MTSPPLPDHLGQRLLDLARSRGTPCYAYVLDAIVETVRSVKGTFEGRFGISYAVKANPNRAVLEVLRDEVEALDVSSIGEVQRALAAGYSPSALSFSGPAKREEELEEAVAVGCGEIICESEREVEVLSRLGEAAGHPVPILLRLNPRRVPRKFGLTMAGRASQFGVDEEAVDDALELLVQRPGLVLRGFHIYSGTNALSEEAIAENFEGFADLFARSAARPGIAVRKLVFGSGFGIPYALDQRPLDLGRLASLIAPIVDGLRQNEQLAGAAFTLEMGRYLVGPHGYFLTSIINEKSSRGIELRMCDGGFNNHLAAYGLMGTVIRRNWPIWKLNETPGQPVREYTLVGPLCTTIDTLATGVALPELRSGDVLAVGSSGAYGLTASPTKFISHPEPGEYALRLDDTAHEPQDVSEVIRRPWSMASAGRRGVSTFGHGLWEAFCATVERGSSRPAIVQGARRLTFLDWKLRSQSIARWLLHHGLGRNDRVLLWMEPSAEMAAAILGTSAAGGIFALLDPGVRGPQVRHALDTIKPALVLRSPTLPLPLDDPGVPVATTAEIGDTAGPFIPPWPALPTDPASIIFTSGSTGRPKGVTQSHGSLVRGCRTVAGYLGLTEDDRIVCPISWSFDYGFGQFLSTAILGTAHVLPRAANQVSLCEAIDEHRPTILPGVPSLWSYLFLGVSPLPKTDISSIRTLTNTGGTIPASVLTEMFRVFGRCRVFLNYGLTESYRTSYLDPAFARVRPRSIGRPIPGVDVLVVRDDGTPAAVNEVGEIVHRGDYLFLGYWADPESTGRALRRDPLAGSGNPGGRPVLYTGDYGRIDEEGLLYFEGRRDHQIKSMGVRVSPAEVETLLYESGLVREVAVFGIAHAILGDEVWAAVVPATGAESDVTLALTRYARGAMSPYMQPRRFLVRDVLPRTTSGKIDYPTLRAEAGHVRPGTSPP
jgi:diaminopimelate decarboxylase